MSAPHNKGMFKLLWSSKSGKFGIVTLILLVVVSISVIAVYPSDFGQNYWSNPVYWADNPKSARPAWTAFFTEEAEPDHLIYWLDKGQSSVELDYQYDQSPTFVSLTIYNLTYYQRPPLVSIALTRPDGGTINLYSLIADGPREGEKAPFSRYDETPLRIQISSDPSVAQAVSDFFMANYGKSLSQQDLLKIGTQKAIFGNQNLEVLKGKYKIEVAITSYDERDGVGKIKVVLGGSTFGVSGTDSLGRDLFQGLLFGAPISLLIGLSVTLFAAAIGTVAGVASGYLGGKTDAAVQRLIDFMTNIPLLPILIFLTFVIGQKLWLVVLLLIIFGWPGLALILRPMVLQIREGQSIEAALCLGASKWRIMFKHILPQVAPFILAQMIFNVSGAILAESSLSFLGLGDPSLPTWGQILEQGFKSGAVYIGNWWWVVPPGLLIVFTATVFIAISLAIQSAINPKLRSE